MATDPIRPPVPAHRLAEVFLEVGPLYRTAANVVADNEHHEGVSTGVRAVLEVLAIDGPSTIPEVATRIGVSRQYVQRNAADAVRANLIETHDNPSHRQSRLMTLSEEGAEAFDRIRSREAGVLERVEGLTDEDIDACLRVLRRLRETLAHESRRRGR